MKSKKRIAGVVLFLSLAIAGHSWRTSWIVVSEVAAQRLFLENSRRLTLFSLDPAPLGAPPLDATEAQRKRYETPARRDSFHGCRILGQRRILNPNSKYILIDPLFKGMSGKKASGELCFAPRHGLRATSGFTTVDFIICFECSQVEVSSGGLANRFALTSAALEKYDDMLVANSLSLGPRPKRD